MKFCSDTCYNTDEHYTKWKEPDTKDLMLQDSIYIKCAE